MSEYNKEIKHTTAKCSEHQTAESPNTSYGQTSLDEIMIETNRSVWREVAVLLAAERILNSVLWILVTCNDRPYGALGDEKGMAVTIETIQCMMRAVRSSLLVVEGTNGLSCQGPEISHSASTEGSRKPDSNDNQY